MNALRGLARGIISLPARLARLGSLGTMRRSPAKAPVLSFGGALDHRKLLHGGAVKLAHLREHFASDERTFNLLYLVSSALPPFAEDLVRHVRKLGIPFVWNQNGVGYPAWAGRDSERFNAPMRRLRAQADYVVYQSLFCRESAEHFLGSCEAPHEILPNPVDLQKFRPAASPPPAEPLRLLAMGTQNYAGRVLSAIDCLKALRARGTNATLTVAGNLLWKDAAAELARRTADLGLTEFVEFRPAFTQDGAAELYRRHHILIHPKYLDPCPTVVIEALASGLPVVGSASGGLIEMVPPACGALIPVPLGWDRMVTPGGPALAAAVGSLVPRLADAAKAARAHAEKTFDAAGWVRRHGEIFHRLLA